MKNFFKVFLAIFLMAAFSYTSYEISRLSNRLQRIENKLGGSKRISCNEKDTVKRVRQSVVRIVGGDGEGSGFAIKKDGFILTNFHVISTEPSPKVILPDDTFETAQVIMADKEADLAILKIRRDLPVVRFVRLNELSAAEELLAIGYPLGGDLPGESFVVRGSFSRPTTNKKDGMRYVLTDMTMVSGLSGGPMVNICGEVVGINTAGLSPGGIGIAIASDSIFERCRQMFASKNPLKDVTKIVFEPNKNALEAVRAFYNYLKVRSMEKAFELLSDNFVMGYSFEHWVRGYRPLLDNTLILIKPDKEIANRINIKLSTKDLIDDEIVCKYFEGYWDVRQVSGKWLLWEPSIREVKEPGEDWFVDQDRKKEIEEFIKTHEDFKEYWPTMYEIWQKPGNESLSLQELYDKAKERENK
ncbi:MAG: trypsin-like peptidase domain-containing protein [Candidatus Omnitrophota bacterium]